MTDDLAHAIVKAADIMDEEEKIGTVFASICFDVNGYWVAVYAPSNSDEHCVYASKNNKNFQFFGQHALNDVTNNGFFVDMDKAQNFLDKVGRWSSISSNIEATPELLLSKKISKKSTKDVYFNSASAEATS
jgi:hypothetical protein